MAHKDSMDPAAVQREATKIADSVFKKNVEDLTEVEMEREKQELTVSIQKLRESNKEIKEFDPQGQDEELVMAVEENLNVIVRREQRLESIEKRLVQANGLDL
eukprot:CAMPEP_0113960366 /NCGR_PEP_ID=MMETSP0011_2-20120614/4670_1 /TAXON_ID=101924 /ORGANISM="Rhodosorus marinus" /LENGTH=102 /DNA_ID=CAMNT_0000971801 /DNA_START=132 /DNA_END=440 /DNA_ORIENTATION=+ /assembly_acc=CAM_ASM_000156